MYKRVKLVSSILMYVLAALTLLFYLIIDLKFEIAEIPRLILLCISCLFMYFGGFILSKYLGKNKPMKINLYIFFVLYLILLITLTLFDNLWLRNGFNIQNFSNIKDRINLIPFKTIITFIKEFNSMYSTNQIILNLFGNVFAFMPMALFLPLLFKMQNKFRNFVITLIIIILGIEFLQLITGSGRFDIDDLILNLFGACIAYVLLNVKSVKGLIHNIFLLEHNKISKKSYIRIILFIIIIVLVFAGIVLYRNKLYDQNYEEYNKINNPDIIFEHKNECGNNNLFYEDKIYKYYFKCYNNNDFYVIVNNEDKLSIKDLLDNSKYNYDISRLLESMNYNQIDYKIEHKYSYFNIKIENNANNSYYIPSNVTSDIADLVIVDNYNNDNKINYEVNIIPKKSGTSILNVNCELYDNNGETIKKVTKKIKVVVDNDFNVSYNEEN